GLISWQANKYSVPLAWQQARVGVRESAGELVIRDLETREEIARHVVSAEKGRMIKNNHHYRDHSQRIADLEAAIVALLDDGQGDRKSTRLNSSHVKISYAVFCLKKKT